MRQPLHALSRPRACSPMGIVHGRGFGRPALGGGRLTPAEQLAARLLATATQRFPEPQFSKPLEQAAREAMRLAGRTGFALLVLPELFAEMSFAIMLRAEYRRLGRF